MRFNKTVDCINKQSIKEKPLKWNKTKNKKEIKFKLYRFYFFLTFLFTIFFECFLELDEEDLFELDLPPAVVGTAGIGGTNIASSPSVEQAFTLAINAIWSDKTARNVESILKSTSDNSSPNAIAKVEAKTM